MSLQYMTSTPQAFQIHETSDLDFLDDVLSMIRSGMVEAGMDKLGRDLHFLYASTSTAEWTDILNNYLLKHPLFELLMQDPLTARSFAQPRGYAGDAVLLDMVYFPYKTDLNEVSELGRQLYKYTTNTSLSKTLCRRIKAIANYIDNISANTPNARVLSVASGHCREASFSRALNNGELDRFVALDHDGGSLEVLQRDYGNLGLESLPMSVRDIVTGKLDIGEFDLIYSAGLFDYLGTRFAQKLTERLFDMLAPYGKLVLINIASDYEEIGYLESYMNWCMIGRSHLETLELAANLKTDARASLNIREIGNINSHYQVLEITKN